MTSGQFGYNVVMELDRSNAVVILFFYSLICACAEFEFISKKDPLRRLYEHRRKVDPPP